MRPRAQQLPRQDVEGVDKIRSPRGAVAADGDVVGRVRRFFQALDERHWDWRPIQTAHTAHHCSALDPILKPYERFVSSLPLEASIAAHINSDGQLCEWDMPIQSAVRRQSRKCARGDEAWLW